LGLNAFLGCLNGLVHPSLRAQSPKQTGENGKELGYCQPAQEPGGNLGSIPERKDIDQWLTTACAMFI
jgi:hypothetical protein